jgi:hypothetical protein
VGGMADAGNGDPCATLTSETCGGSGCARLCIPLTAAEQKTLFRLTIPPTDLTGATATFNACLYTETARATMGWVQPYGQEAVNYQGHWGVYSFGSITGCSTGFTPMTFAFSSGAMTTYYPSQVSYIGLELVAKAGGPWTNPTILYVDSVVITPGPDGGAVPGPFNFNTATDTTFMIDVGAGFQNGSEIGWVP